jgi:hypothetical protein
MGEEMKKALYILIVSFTTGISFNVHADPFVKKNIEIQQLNYGNVVSNSTIENIDNSYVEIGAAGNAVNLSGNIENINVLMESYGNISANASISNVSNSYIQVNAIGNSVTVR